MGTVNSTTAKQALVEFNSFCNTFSIDNATNAMIGCASTNNLNLTAGGAAQCGSDASMYQCIGSCPFSTTQTAQAFCTMQENTTSSLAANIVNNLDATLQQFVDSDTEAASKWLQVCLDVNSSTVTNTSALITKIVNQVKTQQSVLCQGQADATNNETILLCGAFSGPVTISQNASAQIMASCMNSAVLNAFVDNSVLQNIAQNTDNKLVQDSGSSWWWWLIIGAVVVVVVVIVIIVLLRKPKQPQPFPPGYYGSAPQAIYPPQTFPPPYGPTSQTAYPTQALYSPQVVYPPQPTRPSQTVYSTQVPAPAVATTQNIAVPSTQTRAVTSPQVKVVLLPQGVQNVTTPQVSVANVVPAK